jgi:tetratricopeptide (TPR) repeat protein
LKIPEKNKVEFQTFVQSQFLAHEIVWQNDENREQKTAKFLQNLANQLDKKVANIFRKTDKKQIRRELQIAEDKFDRDLDFEMTRDLERIIFERGEKEMIRISDLPQVFKDAWPDFKDVAEKHFKKNFAKEWNKFQKISEKIKNTKNPEEKAELQIAGADVLCGIIYSAKFVRYDESTFSMKQVRQKREANCVGQTLIMHAIGSDFLDAEIRFGTTIGHAFPILKTSSKNPKKQFYSLDSSAQSIDISDRDGIHFVEDYKRVGVDSMPWVTSTRDFDRGYAGNVWDWMRKNKKIKNNPKLKLFVVQQAVLRDPENPGFRNNFAFYLAKNGEWKKAKKEFKIAIALDKNNPWYALVFANFLSGGRIEKFPQKNSRGETYKPDFVAAKKEFERARDLILKFPDADLPGRGNLSRAKNHKKWLAIIKYQIKSLEAEIARK